jgi:hypothetical protein
MHSIDREFDGGLVVVNGMSDRDFNFTLPVGRSYSNLGPTKRPERITGGYEAPLIQFVIDNESPWCGVLGAGIDWSPMACSFEALVDYGQGPPPPPDHQIPRHAAALYCL